tara:strand:- start:70 stop:501 length:432 start_codon:yes stop_codon:yes gene_type:complete
MHRLLIFLLFISFNSNSQVENSYEQALKKFMDTQGTWKLLDIQTDVIFKQFNIDILLKKDEINDLRIEMYKDLLKIYTPIYKKHFSIEELNEMTSFFESGIGNKFVEKSPIMMQEVLPETTKWGMGLGIKIQELIKNKRKEEN